jgi:hypothetical protein
LCPVWCDSYSNTNCNSDANSHTNGDAHTYSITYSYTDTNPMHGEVCTHSTASSNSGASTDSLKDKRGVDLISDALPFGGLWYGEPNAVSNAIGYAKFRSRSHGAVIRVLR